MKHIPALDGLRGVAVLSVLIYHFWPDALPGGYLGVSVFFTLSGFLITSLLVNEYESTHNVNFWRFYDRRFRRLMPAAALVVLACVIFAISTNQQQLLSASDARAAILWHYNWHELSKETVYGGVFASPLEHYWSLAIEEQFYLAFPPLIVLVMKIGGKQTVAATLGIVSMVTIFLSFTIDTYFNTFARLPEILLGCLAAAVLRTEGVNRKNLTSTLLSSGSLVVMATLFVYATLPSGGDIPNFAILLTTVATIVLISTARSASWNILNMLPLRQLGKYSYSLYLWHWPVVVFFDTTVTRLLLTVIASLLSYHLVESPIRNPKKAKGTEHEYRSNQIGQNCNSSDLDNGTHLDILHSPTSG